MPWQLNLQEIGRLIETEDRSKFGAGEKAGAGDLAMLSKQESSASILELEVAGIPYQHRP
jgi:hypothetical protein